MTAIQQSAEAKTIEEEMGAYRQIEAQQNGVLQSRNGLIAQLNENKMVKEELDKLEDEAPVYKLIGPVLMSQDLEEARQNVDKRIEFIHGEM
jgi:prefoldin beta subunit